MALGGVVALVACGAGVMAEPARTMRDAARVATVTRPTHDFTTPEPYEARPAGAGTLQGARFDQPLANLPDRQGMEFVLGEALFEKLWVPAPSSTRASDGLGPLFNARACANCHPGGGRGRPVEPGAITGQVLKLSQPGGLLPDGAPAGWHPMQPDRMLGTQLQDRAVQGLSGEGGLWLDWVEEPVQLTGGSVSLRRPVWHSDADIGPRTATSLRIAPQMIGLGLLAAIPAADLRANADPDDADHDGISGRVAEVYSPYAGGWRMGRFGHKAGAATLVDMSASAFSQDMGLSTPLFPHPWGDCTPAQTDCRRAPHGVDVGLRDGVEVSQEALELVSSYAGALAVPARRDVGSPAVLRGKQAFYGAGCPACHVPKFVTATRSDAPAHSFQLIWPYSDLLLHDMGPGLADTRAEGLATGTEWRTAPLWGIGLTAQNTGHPARFLHDGRARNLLEAVLWHGGEAAPAREHVRKMAPDTRADLIRFLESL
ncbi:thiol oxidoreductase [Rhodobacteraceae bacterium]|nr:thiol oxidoreductase [Paracoccaceae bacterium]